MTKRYLWEKHEYNAKTGEHVKVSGGGFMARTLRSAKAQASRKARVSGQAVWKLHRVPNAFEDEGRVYKRQVADRPEYINTNPIVYLFVDTKSAVVAQHDMPEVGIRKGDMLHSEGGKITGIVPKENNHD